MQTLEGKRILITGGTGSLGKALVRRLLSGECGKPASIVVFSRDEAKQHYMRLSYLQRESATDEVIYENSRKLLQFRIGDVRDYSSLLPALREAHVVLHAAAMKQVPTCEYFPFEAVRTNIVGAHNLVRATQEAGMHVELVVGASTDKACQPINVMGMTKAVQERVLVQANIESPSTRFVCVRYGNVVASRGSVVPLFLLQIKQGGPVTVTDNEMTRFLLTLDQAVDTVFAAIRFALPGEIYVPALPAARIEEVARVLIGDREIPIAYTGIRPGEKIHEVLISEEECYRTIRRGEYFVILPMLAELRSESSEQVPLKEPYCSSNATLSLEGLRTLLAPYLSGQVPPVDP